MKTITVDGLSSSVGRTDGQKARLLRQFSGRRVGGYS